MAATTSNLTPRRKGFDLAALAASAGQQHDGGEELARLRAALETLAEMVVAHGVMDARTLESIVSDLIRPQPAPVPATAVLPPAAPSAAAAVARRGDVSRTTAPAAARNPAPIAARAATTPAAAVRPAAARAPVAAAPAPVAARAPVAAAPAPVAARAPVAAAQAPVAVAPRPIATAPAPVAATPVAVAPRSVAAAPVPAPAPVAAAPGPGVPAAAVIETSSSAAPAPAPAQPRRNPFDAARVEAELSGELPPAPEAPSLFGRLFGKKKTSAAAVAAAAASVEFTERTSTPNVDGLYADAQRATQLSFPPPTKRTPRAAAAPKATAERAASRAPARFCERCWRRVDAAGSCKICITA